MRLLLLLASAALATVLPVPAAGQAKVPYLTEVPKEGDLPYGKIVYVDDRTCPRGEIKEVTGGSQSKAIARKIRCVKRPPG